MDPVSIILSAIVNGAANGLKDSANSAIKGAYSALRDHLAQKHSSVPIEQLEKDPSDTSAQIFAREIIERKKCQEDQRLIELSRNILELTNAPGSGSRSILIADSTIHASARHGNVLVGSSVSGNINYTYQKIDARTNEQRFTAFETSPAYVEMMKRPYVPAKRARHIFLFVFGIPCIALFGVGLLIMRYSFKQYQKGSSLERIPAIVSHKENNPKDSFEGYRIDLIRKGGTVVPTFAASHDLFRALTPGLIGIATVARSGELTSFDLYVEQ